MLLLEVRHKLLARQIKKNLSEEELNNPKIAQFLEIINEAYIQYDEERDLIERSMELSSQELTDSLATLQKQKTELSEAYENLRNTETQLAETARIAEMRREMQEAISLKNEELTASEEELKQNLEELQATQERLQEQKQNLENTQNQLIQSEKMAALGQLVANIAHEVNTPIGAIRSSIDYIKQTLKQTLLDLPAFLESISKQEIDTFQHFIKTASEKNMAYSTREMRQMKRELMTFLEMHEVAEADVVADLMADIGMYETAKNYIELLKHPQSTHLAYSICNIQKSASNIQTAVDKVSKIIFALKNFAYHEANNQMTEADIHESIDTVLTIYQNYLKKGIEVVYKFAEIPRFLCYPDELMQVWTNLLHNAIQAMEGVGTITITTEQKNGLIVVSLADTGGGIPLEIQSKIFDAFFTTKPMGEGSGLGLDIARKIVEKHNGKIYFESIIGVGTTFFVEIPLKDEV